MRISAGKARGIVLNVPPGLAVRPTAGRSRQSLFDSLGDLSGQTVLDLCAGSGGLGFEAASRNAETVVFVETMAKNIHIIEENMEKVRSSGVETKFKIIKADILQPSSFMGGSPVPDIIFCDPPYQCSAEYFSKFTDNEAFVSWAQEALLIWELPQWRKKGLQFTQTGFWETQKIRNFGGIEFLFLKASCSEEL